MEEKVKDVAEQAADSDAFKGAVKNGEKFFESGLATGKSVMKNMPKAPQAYTQSREAIQAAFAAAAGIGASFMDLACFDIIRDTFQNIGLFIADISSEAMRTVQKALGRFFALLNLDLSITFGVSPKVTLFLLGALTVVCVGVLIYIFTYSRGRTPDRIRDGHEVETWEDQKEEEGLKLKIVRYGLTAAMSLYLPVSRVAVQLFQCDGSLAKRVEDSLNVDLGCHLVDNQYQKCNCDNWSAYKNLRFAAIVVFIVFTICFPIYCVRIIKANKPYGSREDPNKCYDEEGRLVDYTDDRYQDDLKNDPNQQNCPYRFMYEGYERKWAYYKVLAMVVKLLLALIVILAYQSLVVQNVASLLVHCVVAGFAFYSTPFLDPLNDVSDVSGRIFTALTLAFGWIGASSSASGVMAIVIQVINVINMIIMGIAAAWGVQKVRTTVKSALGYVQYSDSVKDVLGPAHRIIPNWQIDSEIKRRVWHPFWEALLAEESPGMAKRLREMQASIRDVGKKRVLDHYKYGNDPQVQQNREYVLSSLEGVDVYYNQSAHDGHLDSKTCFGKMYAHVFPFHCVMVWDDSDDYAFLWEEEIPQLIQQNQDPEIQRRRNVREQLRALKDVDITYHLERMETHTVPDGEEQYTDGDGNQKTRTRYSSVQVMITYSKGQIRIGANRDLEMASGFKFTLHLTDGVGEAQAPHTGQMHTIRTSANLSPDALEINERYEDCPALQQIFGNEPNCDILPDKLTEYHNYVADYRNRMLKMRCEREGILNSAFWLHVYDNDSAKREEIEAYFRSFEASEDAKSIPDRHKEGLDYLFNKMAFINAHPCAAIWFVFWSDVWDTNNDIGIIQEHAEDLDPSNSESIAYKPMKRDQLEPWLEERGLLSSWKLIKSSTLDLLYARLGDADEEFAGIDEETGEILKSPKKEEPEEEPTEEAEETEAAGATENPMIGASAQPRVAEKAPISHTVRSAYVVRRNNPASKIVQGSIQQMKQGNVLNVATLAGGAYIPRPQPQEKSEGETVPNPLMNAEEGEEA